MISEELNKPLYQRPVCYFSGENALVLSLAYSFEHADQLGISALQQAEDRFYAQQKLWALKAILEKQTISPHDPASDHLDYLPDLEDVVVGMLNITVYLKIESLMSDQFIQQSNLRFEQRLQDHLQRQQTRLLALWEKIELADWHPKTIKLPTFYGGKYGEDLPEVARHNQLTESQVIELHSSTDYPVYFIGFQPGFPYLGGLSPKLYTPRRSVPRIKVNAGSVGIGGEQTGIYPFDSPGGWQIIGYTPFKLFDLSHKDVVTLRTGDVIRFVPQR